MSTSTPNDPPNQPPITPDMIAKAVSDGVKQVFMSDEVLSALSRTGDGERNGITTRNISSASTVNAVAEAIGRSNVPGKLSDHASMARDALADTSVGGQYMRLPQGLGHLEGRITAQNIAQYANARNNAKIDQLPEGSFHLDENNQLVPATAEAGAALRSANRIGFMQNTALPAYSIMKNAYQQYITPAVQTTQELSALGYSQAAGHPSPLGAAFSGAGIIAHNMGQIGFGGYAQKMLGMDGLIDPLTFAKQQEISGTMMSLGFNFNNPQYGLGESALQKMVRYNPSINVELAGQQMQTALRTSTNGESSTQNVANLTSAIGKLGEVSRFANISIQESQQRMAEFQQMTGYGPSAPVNYVKAQERYPNINPTQVVSALTSTPLGRSAALNQGMYDFQVAGHYGAAGGDVQINNAFEQMIGNSLSMMGVQGDPSNYAKMLNPNTKSGADLLSYVNKIGFQNQFSNADLYKLITKQQARSNVDKATGYMGSVAGGAYGTGKGGPFAGQTNRAAGVPAKYDGSDVKLWVDPKTGKLHAEGSDTDHVDKTYDIEQRQMTPQQALHALHLAGIKGDRAQKILEKDFAYWGNDPMTSGKGKTYLLKGGYGDIQKEIKSQAGNTQDKPSASGLQKAIDGLDNALSGLKDFKNDYDSNQ